MTLASTARRLLTLACCMSLWGCASGPKTTYDYTTYRQHMPRSILVLPPTNQSPDIKASASVFAQVTLPLAEAGYYVIPVALVNETLRENGVQSPDDAHNLPPKKLKEIFGADAVLYLTVTEYGSKFQLLDSVTTVAINGRMMDLTTGDKLWDGSGRLQQSANNGNQGGGLAGLLVAAVVKQIINNVADTGYPVAGATSNAMLRGGRDNGLLWGPRSPNFGAEGKPR